MEIPRFGSAETFVLVENREVDLISELSKFDGSYRLLMNIRKLYDLGRIICVSLRR